MDEDKLTFIILARDQEIKGEETTRLNSPAISVAETILPTDPRITSLPMIGDVNMFFKGVPPDMQNDEKLGDDMELFEAEVEIMIAGSYDPNLTPV